MPTIEEQIAELLRDTITPAPQLGEGQYVIHGAIEEIKQLIAEQKALDEQEHKAEIEELKRTAISLFQIIEAHAGDCLYREHMPIWRKTLGLDETQNPL